MQQRTAKENYNSDQLIKLSKLTTQPNIFLNQPEKKKKNKKKTTELT